MHARSETKTCVPGVCRTDRLAINTHENIFISPAEGPAVCEAQGKYDERQASQTSPWGTCIEATATEHSFTHLIPICRGRNFVGGSR